MALEEYNRKRDFEKTEEPYGDEEKNTQENLRFVIQHHIASHDHYDLRLELGHVLKSWAVPKGPSYNPHVKRLAVQVEDHPFDYRNFEGTIPPGEYGGGTVMIWDEGFWQPEGDPWEGLEKGDLKFTLCGERLKGSWVLVHMKPRPHEKDVNWLLIKEKDEYAECCDVSTYTASVRTGRTMEEIARGAAPVKDRTDRSFAKSHGPKKGTDMNKKAGYDPDGTVIGGVNITHPDKMMFPESGIRKGDVAEYYHAVSDRMMPYIEDRLISTVRCPDGIGGTCFYKKHPIQMAEGTEFKTVTGETGGSEEYFYIKDEMGLLYEVQMNTIEFHLWGSKVEALEQPDTMIFDLDPDAGMELSQIRQGVKDLKSILDDLSLVSYLKTSGGKGYHIVIPFKPAGDWEAFKSFAQNIAVLMETRWPDCYTSVSRKADRKGKIFIDWLRNIRSATNISPYSLRSREGAPVSMPIRWDELDIVAPNEIKPQDALGRISLEDPWSGYFSIEQELKPEKK